MRVRTRARELALQFLFQVDFHDDWYQDELAPFLAEQLDGKPGADEAKAYCHKVVEGVLMNKRVIDELIRGAARNWDLERMAAVDRNALRIGIYELLFADDVPMKVAINEAIELGKRYSTEASGAFVNGILDRVRKDKGL